MKISLTTGYILLLASAGFLWGAPVTSQPDPVSIKNIPPPTPFAVVGKDANSSVWQRTVYEQDPYGNLVSKTHSYTEVATGLHYKQNGQWLDSQEEINILANGTAAATNGQHQAFFPGDIYNGQIELATPDGKKLVSRPVGLSYFDGTNMVMIAELTNSVGQVLGANQVIYTNAFSGLNADLLYTYTKDGFEQDIVLQEQPFTPETYGLNPDTTRLQVLTEFFSPPQPSIQSTVTPPQAGISLTDQSLGFGTMQMIQGRAFLMGESAVGVGAMVSKEWVLLDGRQFLVEELPLNAIVGGLLTLPEPKAQPSSVTPTVSKHLTLPAQRLAKNSTRPVMLAKTSQPARGFVLDYQTVNGSQTNFIFQGDTTYYVSGNFYSYGTNTFEGGAVIKYATNGAINITPGPPGAAGIIWKAGIYRPVVFTASDDNSVGESIGTGTPMGFYGNPMLALNGLSSTPNFSSIRMTYAKTGIQSGGMNANFTNAQFINCENALNIANGAIFVGNSLFANDITNFIFASVTYTVQNSTICGSQFLNWTNSPYYSFLFTNCIFANVTNVAGNISGNYNGFYNSPPFGANQVTNTFYPFQTVGGGSYYLANGCAFTNAGTTNINLTLLASLKQRTTYPPIVYSNTNISTATTLSPQAQRDTESPGPDLGYHYDPIDYAFSDVQVLSPGSVTFNAGTAVAWFSPYVSNTPGWGVGTAAGLAMSNSAAVTFNGTATSPCQFVTYDSVQEGCTTFWMQGYLGGIANRGVKDYTTPATLTASFTHFSHIAWDVNHYRDGESGQPLVVRASNCELFGGFGGYNMLGTYTNCLFDRVAFSQSTGDTNPYAIFINATFHGGSIGITHWEAPMYGDGPPYWYSSVHNSAFDGTTFSISDPFSVNTNYADYNFNAFLYGVTQMSPEGTNNVVVTNSFNWQSSWFGNYYQPTNSLLIDHGDRTADQLGLYHFTTQTNQVKEVNSVVDIGYHYVATDAFGNPLDTNADGIPDYLEDANGDGIYDFGDLGDWQSFFNLKVLITQPRNGSSLP